MNQKIRELPGRGLHLLLMGAAAHEVECEGHVPMQERPELEPSRASSRVMTPADLERLFRGA